MSGPRQAGARVPRKPATYHHDSVQVRSLTLTFGVTLAPISTRDSGRSGKSISSPTSEKPYPLVPLSPSSKLKPKQQTRSVSAESQIDLLPSLEQESAPPVPAFPAANKYIPAKPSPLATAKAVSAAPRWGEAPFVSATVPSSSVTRADDSHATSSPLPVPSQPSANSYILAPPISDPTSLAPSTSSQVVTDPTTKRVSHAASVQSAGSYYSQSNIDGPTSPRDRYSEQFEGHVVEGQGSGRKGQVVSGQFDFDNRTSYNPSVIAPPGPAYVGHDGAGYEYGSGPHSGYQSGYAYGGEQQYPPQQYQQYPDYQQQQQYQHRTSYDPRHSQQQQQLQRYSQQGGWDQEGYGPRYTEESGYPAEELDGYYGSNSRPGSYAGPNSGA